MHYTNRKLTSIINLDNNLLAIIINLSSGQPILTSHRKQLECHWCSRASTQSSSPPIFWPQPKQVAPYTAPKQSAQNSMPFSMLKPSPRAERVDGGMEGEEGSRDSRREGGRERKGKGEKERGKVRQLSQTF